MKKRVGLLLLSVAALFAFCSVKALTTWSYDGWTDGSGYGTATKVDDVITNLKGEATVGPFSKASTAVLEDGITEEVYVEVDPSTLANKELFEITLGLKNGAGEYVSESVITSQKDGEVVNVSVKGAPDFEGVITTKGIYTYQWNMYVEDGKTYVEVTLLQGNRELATSGKIDMDVALKTDDTKNPIAEQEDVSVKYLWFCNISAANGVNVYSELPTVNLTLVPSIEGEEDLVLEMFKYAAITPEELEEFVEELTAAAKEEGYTFDGFFADEKYEEEYDMTTPFTEDVTVYVKFSKIEEEKNPATADNFGLYAGIGMVSLIGLAGAALYINKKRYN